MLTIDLIVSPLAEILIFEDGRQWISCEELSHLDSKHLEPLIWLFLWKHEWLKGRGMEKNRISSHRFFSSIFKTLDIHTVKYVPKSLFVKAWSFWECLLRFVNQTKLYFLSQEHGCPISQGDQEEASAWGQSRAHRCLGCPSSQVFYSSSLPSCVPRAKQDCLNWPQNRWPCRAAPQYPFCADVRKIWDCFLSQEKEGLIWISSCSSQALWVGSGRMLGQLCDMPQPLGGACLLPWGDIKHIACWAVCIFSLPKASWTD